MEYKVGKLFLYSLFLNMFILLWGIIAGSNLIFIIAVNLWVDMMLYAYNKVEKRSLLFAFGVSIFVFLMGRECLQQFLHYKVEKFDAQINMHLYICLILVIASLWISYFIFASKRERKIYAANLDIRNDYARIVLKISKMVFFCTMPFSLVYNLIVATFVSNYGYTSYYTDYSSSLSGNTVLYLLSRIELIMPLALAIIMASLPLKKDAKWPIILYFIYLIISLGGGQRSTFVLGILLIFVFLVYMQGLFPDENWFKRKYFLYLVACIPILAISGTVINITRFGGTTEGLGLFESFFDFFYDQGVTGNIIKRAYQYSDNIPDDCIYIFEFLHSGVLARLLGIPVYNGNSVEHALNGNSFTHALGYTIMGNTYLMGRGTGSSYVAELYFDFGYIGIIIGTILYSWIFNKMTINGKNNVFIRALVFAIITQLLWAPRASYTGFLSFLDAPSTILTLVFVFGLSKLILSRKQSGRIKSLG